MISPYNHMKFMFWLLFVVTVGTIATIALFHENKPTVLITTGIFLFFVLLYIHEYRLYNKHSKDYKNGGQVIPSKGTSNADRMGETHIGGIDPPIKKGSAGSGVSTTIEITRRCFKYIEPVDFPEEVVRMLTENELEILDKHYHGLYHSIGVDTNEKIQLSTRANGKATHYTYPYILADYMLDEEE